MKYVKIFLCFILFFETGCSSPSSQYQSDKKTSALPLRNINQTCDVSQTASEETQSIIWQALWNEDGSQIIGLKNDFNTYNFFKVLSVEGKDFDIVVPRKYLYFSHDMYDRSINSSLPLLYVKFLDDSTIRAELHIINKTNFREIHALASDRNNNNTLADYPITEMEGCYDLSARKVENTLVSVTSEGNGWRDDPAQMEQLFQDRDIYLTLSYGIYKSNSLSSTEDKANSSEVDEVTENPSELLRIEETSFYIELIDSTDDDRPNIHVAFKQNDVEFNDSDSLVRPSIGGLGFFHLSMEIVDIINFPGIWNDFSDEIFNNHISQKILNPFEIVFGFSGGHGSEQMDFTVSITQDTSGADTQ